MYVPFSELPPHTRIWIYQASRNLSPAETTEIEQKATDFVTKWAAHGASLKASARVLESAFLVLAVDEKAQGASGCSIDSSTQFVRSLEAEYGITLLDRTKIAFQVDGQVQRFPLSGLKALVTEGKINPQTLYFNTMAGQKSDLESNWLVPASASWLAKYFESAISK